MILLRSPNARQKLYERVLAEQGITCAAAASEEFFSAMEIAVVYAMLQLIDNPRQDVPLIAALRSPVFAFFAGPVGPDPGQLPRGRFLHRAVQRRGRGQPALFSPIWRSCAFWQRT